MGMLKKTWSTEFLLLCGVIGPVLFVVALLIEGATRPGYSAWQTDGSYLALTSLGWQQIANFIVSGTLCIAYAIGLRRTLHTGRASVWGPLLIGLFGLGLLLAGIFVTDPGGGYPAGAPLNGHPITWHGWVHGINGLLLFNVVLPAACFVLASRFATDRYHGWATYSRVTGVLLFVLSITTMIGLPFAYRAGFPVIDGFVQRILITMGWSWVSLTALHFWQKGRRVAEATRLASVRS